MIPRWAMLIIGAVIAAVLAIYLTPVFPAPISVILYWLLWIVAAIALILAVLEFIGWTRGRPVTRA
jgi:hypothetical protein